MSVERSENKDTSRKQYKLKPTTGIYIVYFNENYVIFPLAIHGWYLVVKKHLFQ
jgi:hypothetical protein